jgi:hypothetical protein
MKSEIPLTPKSQKRRQIMKSETLSQKRQQQIQLKHQEQYQIKEKYQDFLKLSGQLSRQKDQKFSNILLQLVSTLDKTKEQKDYRQLFLKNLKMYVFDEIYDYIFKKIKSPQDIIIIDGLNIIRSKYPKTRQNNPNFFNNIFEKFEELNLKKYEDKNIIILWILPYDVEHPSIIHYNMNTYIIECPFTKQIERRNDDVAVLATIIYFSIQKNMMEKLQSKKEEIQTEIEHIQSSENPYATLSQQRQKLQQIKKRMNKESWTIYIKDIYLISRDNYDDWKIKIDEFNVRRLDDRNFFTF